MAQNSPKTYKGRGVVLHTLKYGENAMVVHLLTDVGGRESFIVRGVHSSRGRGSKAALFQPLFTLDFEGIYPSHGELHSFREVRSGMILRQTPFDVRRSTIALFIAEVLYRLVKESAPNEPLFDLVWNSIEALDSIEEGVANFHLWFLTALSCKLGFMPSGEFREGMWFDICEGTFCTIRPSHEMSISPNEAKILHSLMTCRVEDIAEIKLNRVERVKYIESLIRYYNYHLNAIQSVRSIEILRELF